MGILLQCAYDKLKRYTKLSFQYPFPQFKQIYREGEELMFVMQKMELKFLQVLKIVKNLIFQASIIAQIAYLLRCLQDSCGFTHSDLHIGNVMFIKELYTISVNISKDETPDYRFVRSSYRPYFIDLGMACVDLSECCNLSTKKVGVVYEKVGYEQCGNKSFDLRVFLLSLLKRTRREKVLGEILQLFIEKLVEFSVYKDKYNEILLKETESDVWSFQEMFDIDDPVFYPENVLINLVREIPLVFKRSLEEF